MRYNTIKQHFGVFRAIEPNGWISSLTKKLKSIDFCWGQCWNLHLWRKSSKSTWKSQNSRHGGQSVWNVKLWTSVWTHYTVLICLSVSGLVSPWGECSPALHSAASTVRYRWCPLQCQSWAREEGRTTPSTPLDRKPWICIWVRSIMITSASSRKINSEQRQTYGFLFAVFIVQFKTHESHPDVSCLI